jgi:hypothetical protein
VLPVVAGASVVAEAAAVVLLGLPAVVVPVLVFVAVVGGGCSRMRCPWAMTLGEKLQRTKAVVPAPSPYHCRAQR